ncbi:MAG: hypothetical protein ABI396_04670 [Ktedonobacteraceae bacterium]
MPKIFEIFGYPIDDASFEANENRRAAKCPFMGRDCDGGGNRYSSNITIKGNEALEAFFGNREKVCAGVCSIQTSPETSPWIVCPRRLLVLGREAAGKRVFQRQTEEQVLQLLDYEPGTRLGIWPEVKLKYEEEVEGIRKTFDYTFDYILMPLAHVSLESLEQAIGVSGKRLLPLFQKGGYTIRLQDPEHFIEDCPTGIPNIIEIMTSSTSGGNKDKGTTISGAFQDAILGRSHRGPGINYRQVWARMVSQLIVKSEVALGWNGKAIWVVQDVLVDYISRSTGLNVHKFVSEHTSEVNMLSFSFNEAFRNSAGVIELSNGKLFAGPISHNEINHQPIAPGFQDMVRTPVRPSLRRLIETLAQRKPVNEVVVP